MNAVAAAIYCRISRDHDGLRAGVDRQETDCRAECERRGWTVTEVYTDNDVSAYTGKARPGYNRMLTALAAGTSNAVVAWHNDRLHRSPAELEEFIALVERTEAKVAIVTGGDYDLTTPDGRLAARIVGAVARKESEDKSRRLRRKHLELAQQGQAPNGIARLGFGFGNEEEAEQIRHAVRHVLSGGSLRSIAQAWECQPRKVRDILLSGRIAGLRDHRGALYPAQWPAIVGREDWEEVRAILKARTRKPDDLVRKYLLAGLAHCGLCGQTLIARNGYTCPPTTDPGRAGCGKIRVQKEGPEAVVTGVVLRALTDAGVATQELEESEEVVTARAELPGVERRLAELEDRYVDGGMELPLFERLRSRLLTSAEDMRAKLADAAATRQVMPAPSQQCMEESWVEWTLEQRRSFVKLVVGDVRIQPARRGVNRFDPSRVQVFDKTGALVAPGS
jgi:site-specific DNA recombinase